ncbi:hypothetical protein GCM10010193_13530 [Kitasatospora atroaurantiaca]|uniref:4-amino-4-deoxy-L-arabinose transferase-like glycosyltransferase n=1 Tax=Kitasatospora atroaurantiaca TaxID=285545 RepID=A0A561ESV4_9ACTN|nr:glycosyltransferase family 39 protein [Kitasatospora atroaurantiaca]TWE18688.1 4-amino-4-deoxy-L-arabinose transferase-like glycosyltransferase [Kitasatospora atroaurantiaca]
MNRPWYLRVVLGHPNEPRWARPSMWAVLALATVLYCWNLSSSGEANSYYSAAVLSGTKSWSAMFYGSLDAGNFITVDKPPVALWLMVVSCRVFGFGTLPMLLPIALSGVASVGVLYSAVRRSFGHRAALAAALVLALTPISAAINRDNNPDPVLVLFMVISAWFCLEAIRSGRLMPLVWSAVATGFAFNTKMLQGYVALPALVLAYALCARPSVGRRVRNLLVAGAALVVSSGWWMGIVALVPTADRPYIGSSSDNTVWDLVIGYNGLGRVLGADSPTGMGGANFGGEPGLLRMANSILGTQISWLIPFALVVLAAGLVLRGRRPLTDTPRAGLLVWGGWMVIHLVVFSFGSGGFHPYYTTALGPGIAGTAGAGGAMLLRAFRARRPKWAPAVLPLAIGASAVWAVVLLRRNSSFHGGLWLLVLVGAVGAVAALFAARAQKAAGASRLRGRLYGAGAGAALIALLAGPAAYAAAPMSDGGVQGVNPTAGPSSGGMGGMGGGPGGMGGGGGRGGFPGGGAAPEGMRAPGDGEGGFPGGTRSEGTPTGESGAPTGGMAGGSGMAGRGGMGGGGMGGADSKMISYLEQHQDGATWLVATSRATSAAQIILQTGKPAIATGGFSGSDPAMTLDRFKLLVQQGKLHYILLGGGMGGGGMGGGGGGRSSSGLESYVTSSCTLVSASEYGSTASTTTTTTQQSSSEQLYRCG